jgi:hypothetical protein
MFLRIVAPPAKKVKVDEVLAEKAEQQKKDRFQNLRGLAETQINTWIDSWSDEIKSYPKGFIRIFEEVIEWIKETNNVPVEVLEVSLFPFASSFALSLLW